MSRFPTTHWSLIHRVGENLAGSSEQLGRLLETYRHPMYVHLRSKGVAHEQAEDLIQDFTIEILNKNLLAIADPRRGRFRTLLLTALDRFMVGRYRYETAAKRAPEELLSLDAPSATTASTDEPSPSLVFERAWAIDVLAQTLAEMKHQCETNGDAARWSVFESRFAAPLLDDAPCPKYDELAQRFKLKDGKAAMNLLVTGKRQFARILREIVRDYVSRGNDAAQRDSLARSVHGKADRQTAARVADHLTESSISRTVEEEIDQLQLILAQSKSLAETVLSEAPADSEASELRMRFWQQLSQQDGESDLDKLFSCGTEPNDDDAPLSVYFTAVLNSSLSEFSGLRVEKTGTLYDCLLVDDPSLDAFSAIKEWANQWRSKKDKTLTADFASGVYFLVLAVAYIRCKKRITGMSLEAMRAGFVWLAEQPWLDVRVKQIVNAAIDALSQASEK